MANQVYADPFKVIPFYFADMPVNYPETVRKIMIKPRLWSCEVAVVPVAGFPNP